MKQCYRARNLAIAMALAFPICAEAGTSTGLVNLLYVHIPIPTYTSSTVGVVMFAAGTMKEGSVPGCALVTRQWAFSLSTLHGRAMYDLLLYAANKGKPVTVVGTGACSAWSDRETPKYIVIAP